MSIEVLASDAKVQPRDDGSVDVLVPLSGDPSQHWRDLLEDLLRGHGSQWRWRIVPRPEVVLTATADVSDDEMMKELRLLRTLVTRTNQAYQGGRTTADTEATRLREVVRRWAESGPSS